MLDFWAGELYASCPHVWQLFVSLITNIMNVISCKRELGKLHNKDLDLTLKWLPVYV